MTAEWAPLPGQETEVPYSALLVDLDGTVIDSAPGIIGSLVWTIHRLGRSVPSDAALRGFIGPPILDGLASLGMHEAEAREALAIYREHYRAEGMLAAPVYPGMAEWLRDQAEAGRPMSLATSKPESAARRILEHVGLADAFTVITGASEDEKRSEKADVIAEAMVRLDRLGVDLSRPVMVGDRIHDVEGARANGIVTTFVTWGYGSPAEAVDAIAIARDVPELRSATG